MIGKTEGINAFEKRIGIDKSERRLKEEKVQSNVRKVIAGAEKTYDTFDKALTFNKHSAPKTKSTGFARSAGVVRKKLL